MNARQLWLGAGVGLAVSAVALPWVAGHYLVSVATFALVMVMASASGQLLAVAGLPTLDRAVYVGAGAYAASLMSASGIHAGVAQIAAGAAAATAGAAVLGLIVSRTRGLVTLLVTFGIGELAVSFASHSGVLGDGNGRHSAPVALWPGSLPTASAGPVYLYVLAITLTAATATVVLLRSPFGLTLRAIATHEGRTAATGYHVTWRLWVVYLIAGLIAGAAGAALIASRRFVAPADLGFELSATALVAAILGGRHLALAAAVAIGLVAVRDLAGGQAGGYGPLLLGCALIAAALTSRLKGSRA